MALPNKCPNHLLIVLIGIFSADQISQGLYINNIGYLFTKLEKMHELCVLLYFTNNMETIYTFLLQLCSVLKIACKLYMY